MIKSIIFTALTILTALTIAHANPHKNAMIEGIKFLDDVPEVEWYRVDGRNLIVGWKGIPQFFPHTNRKAATRAAISTGGDVYVWAVRHNQKKWKVGSGEKYICTVSSNNNGKVKSDTCPF